VPGLSVSVGCIWHGCGTDDAQTAPDAVGDQARDLRNVSAAGRLDHAVPTRWRTAIKPPAWCPIVFC